MENLQLNFLARKRDLWGNSQYKQLYEKKNHRVPNSSTMKNLERSRNNVGSNPCPFQVTVSRLICGWQLHFSIYSDTCYVRPWILEIWLKFFFGIKGHSRIIYNLPKGWVGCWEKIKWYRLMTILPWFVNHEGFRTIFLLVKVDKIHLQCFHLCKE